MRKKLMRGMTLFGLTYGLIGLLLYYAQDWLLFRPQPLDSTYVYEFTVPHSEVNLPYTTQSSINIIQFHTQHSNPKGVILYFHGNRNNIGWYARYAPYFTNLGYAVWMIDYPGYGKSTGSMSENKLYEWALQLYKLARVQYRSDQIIIYGKSMGTGIAAQLASVRDCRRLILETPYYDFPSVLRPYFFLYPLERIMHYQFPTYQYLPLVSAQVTLLHGTGDGIVRYSNSEKLLALLKKGDGLITIEGGSHNNLYDYPKTSAAIDSLLR